MPGGRTKFQEKWLEAHDGNGELIGSWCTKTKTETDAYCLLCKCNLSVANSGIAQILQHALRQKHRTASKLLTGQRTLTSSHNVSNEVNIMSCSGSRSLSVAYTIDQTVTRAEALWAMKVAISDFSFESCKDIVPLFKIMFEGHPVASAMKLGDRKVSYILSHGLGPYFHSQTVSDLKSTIDGGGFFSLSFDETTTSQIKKQLDLHVRYWSFKSNKVVSSYLTSLFFGHADAEQICKGILKAMQVNVLPISKILMLSMDGPNVNLLVAKKINEELSKLGSKLVDIDTCSLHKVHNCFSKALDELPLNVDEFATDLFSFFKQSAARREDLQNLLECNEKFLMRHVSSRWLTLGPVVDRIISIYKSLEEYFLKFIPKQKNNSTTLQNQRYKRIVSTLRNPETIVYLEFISALVPLLQSYLGLFQTEGPLVHLLYSQMNKLLRNVLLKFMKEEKIGNLEGKELLKVDIENFENYKKLKDLDIGVGTKRALSCLKENNSNEARMALRSRLVKLAKSLDSLPLTNSVLRDLEILHPFMKEVINDDAIRRLSINLKPLNTQDRVIDNVGSEWQAYRLDSDVQKLCEDFRSDSHQHIDIFWKNIFELKEVLSGKPKYPNFATFVKNCLILSHGNADVERGFSLNNTILSKYRLSISESTIIGIRHVKDAVKRHGDIFSVPMTGKLLNCVVKSYSVYAAEKEAITKAAEEEKKKRKVEEEEKQQAEEIKKRKQLRTEQIINAKTRAQFLQDELTSANKCLADNNVKLREALKKKDYVTVRILSTLIETNTSDIQRISKEMSSTHENLNKLQSC